MLPVALLLKYMQNNSQEVSENQSLLGTIIWSNFYRTFKLGVCFTSGSVASILVVVIDFTGSNLTIFQLQICKEDFCW